MTITKAYLIALGAFAGTVLVALPVSPAHAAGSTCPRAARLVRGHLSQVTWGKDSPLPNGTKPYAGRKMTKRPLYVAASTVVFTYGGNRYRAAKDTQFGLSCYGQHVGAPLWARVWLDKGKVAVKTVAKHPGAVSTQEALVSPVGKTAQAYKVTRVYATPKGGDTGTTTLRSTGPVMQFTPERGATAGHCIFHHDIIATSHFSNKVQNYTEKIDVVS